MTYLMRLNKKEYQINKDLYERLRDLKNKNLTDVILNGNTYKLSDIDLFILVEDDVLDFTTINDNYDNNFEVGSPERMQNIKNDIRKLLNEKINRDNSGKFKQQTRDEQHANAVADVWEHLKSSLNAIKCPEFNSNWKIDRSITGHTEGRESHSVVYYTKEIDLGDKYDKNFWCEAAYIKCDECNKVIKHEIRIFNDYESQVVIRNLLKN